MYRYEIFYDEATGEGTLIEMPADFQRAYARANTLSFTTRTDIVVQDALILQSGIYSVVSQYKNDLYRMHNTIAQNIQSLHTLLEVSEEIFFPERIEVLERVNYLETQVASEREERVESLDELVKISTEYLAKALSDFELTKKNLILQDIDALRHEITFLDSVYRVNKDATLTFDEKIFSKLYAESFTGKKKAIEKSEQLTSSFSALSHLLEPYRIESQGIRKIAREKRADMIIKEAEKWIETLPPAPPLMDIFSLIFISLKEQKMYVYEDGDLILSTPITSGRQNFETVRGTFKIYTKQRNKLMKSPFPEEEYELWVDYWMGFYGAYGIHDACNAIDCWRTRF